MANGVLIIDTDINASIIAATLLDVRQIPVRIAIDATEARFALEQRPPAILLVDLALVARDGFELWRRVQQRTTSRPTAMVPRVVVMAERTERELERFVARLGVDGFVRKPFDPRQLLDTVENLLAEITPTSSRTSSAQGVEAG